MSKSKRTLLRSLLVGILSVAPVAGLAVMTPGPTTSSSNSTINQRQMAIMPADDVVVETPVGGTQADVDVPGVNPDIDVGVETPVAVPEVGISVTSMTGSSGVVQNSNGISESPSAIMSPKEGENGVPVQPVPNSPPGGTIANQPPLEPNGGFGPPVRTAVNNQGGNDEVTVPVEPTRYHGGGHYYRGHTYYTNRGGYYYVGPRYYAYQPYDYYYPYRGYAYYPYEDYYLYYNYNNGW